MNYWLDVFSGTTWDEFRKDGATITGFNNRFRRLATKIQPGDIFLCYLRGVQLWVGALEAVGPTSDKRKIWSQADFPVRFKVRPTVMLDPEFGVPMKALESKVDFFAGPQHAGKYKGFVRFSPNRFKREQDGQLILQLLQEAQKNRVPHPVDKEMLYPRLFTAETGKGKKVIVAIPAAEEAQELTGEQATADEFAKSTDHTQIQHLLLALGAELGYDVWVARNDRSKVYNGQTLGKMPRIAKQLPKMPSRAADSIVELIDVLWLQQNAIVAAFEVECTTAIYSGLLRMSDLLALMPHLSVKLYVVAPDERRGRVRHELIRPTFKMRKPPLAKVCGFLPMSVLKNKVEGARTLGLLSSLKAEFLESLAEQFGDDEETAIV